MPGISSGKIYWSGMVGQGYCQAREIGQGWWDRDIVRQETFFSGMVREGIFSGGRNSFSDGENRDIFRWEKLFQGW
jgi:hypothetical protein